MEDENVIRKVFISYKRIYYVLDQGNVFHILCKPCTQY